MKVLWIQGEGRFPPTTGMFIYSQGLSSRTAALPDCEVVVSAGAVAGKAPDFYRIARSTPMQKLRNAARSGSLGSRRSSLTNGPGPIAQLLAEFKPDVAVIDHLRNAFVADDLVDAGVPYCFMSQNVESDIARQRVQSSSMLVRPLRRLDQYLSQKSEERMSREALFVTALTEEDAVMFRELGAENTLVLPAALEDIWPHPPSEPSAATRSGAVLAGSLYWEVKQANALAYCRAFADRADGTGVTLRVVGRMNDDLADQIGGFGPSIEVVPNPDDMASYLTDRLVGVVPEFVGGGFKLKWLDYAGAGLSPVAATQAVAGLPDAALAAVVCADNPERLAELTIEACLSPEGPTDRAATFQESVLTAFAGEKTARRLADRLAAAITP